MTIGGCLCALRALGRGSAGLGTMCQLNTCTCIGYMLPTFGGYMTVGWCLCALRALGWETNKYFEKFAIGEHVSIEYICKGGGERLGW